MYKIYQITIIMLLLVKQIRSFPVIEYDDIIEHDLQIMMPDETSVIEAKQNLNEKSVRLLGFLSALNNVGKLFNPTGNTGILSTIGNGNTNSNNNNAIPATTPRLNGRPGLGYIPDVTKGINTILTGVAAGNLEKILEGSFVFAPNGVQLVAGSVLDRVFLPTVSPVNTSGQTSNRPTTTTKSLTSAEAQNQLLQIIQEQQKQIIALESIRDSKTSTTDPNQF